MIELTTYQVVALGPHHNGFPSAQLTFLGRLPMFRREASVFEEVLLSVQLSVVHIVDFPAVQTEHFEQSDGLLLLVRSTD